METDLIFDALRRELAISCPISAPPEWEHAGLAPDDPKRGITLRMITSPPASIPQIIARLRSAASDAMWRKVVEGIWPKEGDDGGE